MHVAGSPSLNNSARGVLRHQMHQVCEKAIAPRLEQIRRQALFPTKNRMWPEIVLLPHQSSHDEKTPQPVVVVLLNSQGRVREEFEPGRQIPGVVIIIPL